MNSLRGPGVLAVAVLLLAGVVVMAWPREARLWLVRTLHPLASVEWPRRTRIDGIQTEYRVRRGDFLAIRARAGGVLPREGRMDWRVRPAEPDPTSPASRKPVAGPGGSSYFDVQPDGRFFAQVGPLLDSIDLSVRVGDARIDGIRVEVISPPELASIEAVYRYPAFTGRPPDRLASGDVRALVGTTVELTFASDRPMRRAEIVFQAEEPGPAATRVAGSRSAASGTRPDGPLARQMELESPHGGHTSFVVRERCRYQLRLFDAYGFTGDAPATFVIDPVDNELPLAVIHRPESEHTVTPATRLTLRFEASDDYGVTHATLGWRKRSAEPGAQATSQAAERVRQQPIPIQTPGRNWNARYVWDLASAGLQAGDELEYHVRVGDAGEHLTVQKTGRSAVQVLKVVEPEALRQALEGRLKQSLGEMDHLAQQQAAGIDAISMAIVSLPEIGRPAGESDAARVRNEYNRQVAIRRQAGRLAGRIERLAEELDESFLADGARVADLKLLAGGLADLAGLPMQRVVDELEQARSSVAETGAGGPSEEH